MKSIYPIQTKVQQHQREASLNQKATLIWFTGLSGSGKSTLATHVEAVLQNKGYATYLLDGDNVRDGLNQDLGFDANDRIENIRRIAELSKLFLDAGVILLDSFISPFQADRNRVKDHVGASRYIEVFVDTPLEVCEQRDVKGLYQRARRGEIKNFTGIDSPYEKPSHPDIVIQTATLTVDDSVDRIIKFLIPRLNYQYNNVVDKQTIVL